MTGDSPFRSKTIDLQPASPVHPGRRIRKPRAVKCYPRLFRWLHTLKTPGSWSGVLRFIRALKKKTVQCIHHKGEKNKKKLQNTTRNTTRTELDKASALNLAFKSCSWDLISSLSNRLSVSGNPNARVFPNDGSNAPPASQVLPWLSPWLFP